MKSKTANYGMWKNYLADYLKNNRSAGISVMAASFVAALFLTFLCSLFYNFWLDDIAGTKLEDGDWHGRITGTIDEKALSIINAFANVEKAVVNETLSDERQTVVDVYFYKKKNAYRDLSDIIKALGLSENAADYNYQLLSLYLIRIPGDRMPRLIMPAYLAIVVIVCLSLILVIHNSFAVSMNSRIRQFGIFSSVGATPGQIRICLILESLILATVPILLGLLSGISLSYVTIRAMIAFAANLPSARRMTFGWHPAVWALILLLSVLTVLISAWLPARKLSRLTPLEAIRQTGELQLPKQWNRIPTQNSFHSLFGMEGILARNALRAQKKALRTTSLSLTLAFLGFLLIQCFFTLSGISTNHTYFEAFQDAWDIMVTVKDTPIENFRYTEELRSLPKAADSVVYQKAKAACILPEEALSEELSAMGGLKAFAEDLASSGNGTYKIQAPLVILDDKSFQEFCGQIGIDSRLDGAIVLNRFWDSLHSNFRYPQYLSYIKEDVGQITLQNAARTGEATPDSTVEIPVLACTRKPPALREEYAKEQYPLVQFLPLSLWKEIGERIGGTQQDTFVRVLADNRTDLGALNVLEEEIALIIGEELETESENRIRERENNDKMIEGYKLILGAFCVLLAIIGIAHVFSHTMGFLYQRKREFARYMSVGLTPAGIRKIFRIEALILAGRPVLVALALTTAAVALMIKASYLDPMEFVRAAPVAPISVFLLTVLGSVALAYRLGGRQLLKLNMAEALRDDTLL